MVVPAVWPTFMIALQKQLAEANASLGNPAQQPTIIAHHISDFRFRDQFKRLLFMLPLLA